VLVLEKYLIPGGSAAHFKRDGYTFDVGSSMMFGFGDKGTTNLITKALEAVGKRIETVPDPTQVHYHLPKSAAHPEVEGALGAAGRQPLGTGRELLAQRGRGRRRGRLRSGSRRRGAGRRERGAGGVRGSGAGGGAREARRPAARPQRRAGAHRPSSNAHPSSAGPQRPGVAGL
jgi:hypothetical protein